MGHGDAALGAGGRAGGRAVRSRGGRRAAAGGQPGRDAAGGGGADGGHAAQAAQRRAGGEGRRGGLSLLSDPSPPASLRILSEGAQRGAPGSEPGAIGDRPGSIPGWASHGPAGAQSEKGTVRGEGRESCGVVFVQQERKARPGIPNRDSGLRASGKCVEKRVACGVIACLWCNCLLVIACLSLKLLAQNGTGPVSKPGTETRPQAVVSFGCQNTLSLHSPFLCAFYSPSC